MTAGDRDRLAQLLDALAGYNDKGHVWSGHDAPAVAAWRAAQMAGIRDLVARIGPDRLPAAFVAALDDGGVEFDATGRWGARVRAGAGH